MHFNLFRKNILQDSVVWVVCQMKWNLFNGKEINHFKLWTANEQEMDDDIAKRKRGYDEEIKYFEYMDT